MFKINTSNELLTVNTDKFKDFILSVRFSYSNTEPYVTLSNLLSYIITDRSLDYPSKQEMSLKMDELFGLNLNAKTSSLGYAHTLEIRIKTLNERYTDYPHLKASAEFLYSAITNPLFNETTFNEAKINLESTLNLKKIIRSFSFLSIIIVFGLMTSDSDDVFGIGVVVVAFDSKVVDVEAAVTSGIFSSTRTS